MPACSLEAVRIRMTIVQDCIVSDRPAHELGGTANVADGTRTIRIGLLGLGRVGSAVARHAGVAGPWRIDVTCALVRDRQLPREAAGVAVTSDPEVVFASRPAVVVEALGGLEPARTLVLEAL